MIQKYPFYPKHITQYAYLSPHFPQNPLCLKSLLARKTLSLCFGVDGQAANFQGRV